MSAEKIVKVKQCVSKSVRVLCHGMCCSKVEKRAGNACGKHENALASLGPAQIAQSRVRGRSRNATFQTLD
jgi:hypothetical protein